MTDPVCTCPRDDPYQRDCPVHGSLITDEDVQDVAEWLHPVWFNSEHGTSQTYSDLERAVRGALESRADAMRDRWVAAAREAGREEGREEAAKAMRGPVRRLTAALIAVDSLLTKPYPDDPRWTPWTRFVEPALREVRAVTDA